MEVKVSLNNLRITPRKVRQVIDLIRNKDINKARAILEFTIKRGSGPVLKLLNSAVASALHDFKLKESDLYISQIIADEGPKLKRIHPMSRGRAYPILKRTSHITLVLSEINSDKENLKKSKISNIDKKPENQKSKSKNTNQESKII